MAVRQLSVSLERSEMPRLGVFDIKMLFKAARLEEITKEVSERGGGAVRWRAPKRSSIRRVRRKTLWEGGRKCWRLWCPRSQGQEVC